MLMESKASKKAVHSDISDTKVREYKLEMKFLQESRELTGLHKDLPFVTSDRYHHGLYR